MPKMSKRFYCKCVRKNCPLKNHIITDPYLREMIRDEELGGVKVHIRINTVVFIEQI